MTSRNNWVDTFNWKIIHLDIEYSVRTSNPHRFIVTWEEWSSFDWSWNWWLCVTSWYTISVDRRSNFGYLFAECMRKLNAIVKSDGSSCQTTEVIYPWERFSTVLFMILSPLAFEITFPRGFSNTNCYFRHAEWLIISHLICVLFVH